MELRVERILKRDPHRDKKQIMDIMERQMPEEEKLKAADFVIYNDEHSLLTTQVLKVHQEILALSERH
jgi:dephospho-CoA kinase